MVNLKEGLVDNRRYNRNFEGISAHCGRCTLVFGSDCNDCPNKQKREVADNFIDHAALKPKEKSYLLLQQLNSLYMTIKLVERCAFDFIGLQRFNQTITKIDVELNLNIPVNNFGSNVENDIQKRRPAFKYLFKEKLQRENPDNPFPILVGADRADKNHRAKYYVKTVGREGVTPAIIRMEMMLKKIEVSRGSIADLYQILDALYRKHALKYQWIEAVAGCNNNDQEMIKIAIIEKINAVSKNGANDLEMISLAMRLLMAPIKYTKANNKRLMKLISLGVAEKVMRAFYVISPKYFVGASND